ncbi:MAG: homoserine kinase [Planctomycetota bacterium]|nr:homoserine kinase [Planctomycetota bacterium]
MAKLRVRVPASTSNLGPGFDLLGLALGLFVEVSLEPIQAVRHRLSLPSAPTDQATTWPLERNLVLGAYEAAFRAVGRTPLPAHFRATSQVPVARGLGSSGAATAAGLLLAAAVLGDEAPDMGALHELGISLEGHPDNVTASLFGGCTLCLPASERAREQHRTALVHQEVADSLGFAVAWSDATLSTERARAVLPASVPLEDAIENPRRLAMLLEGLRTGDPELLSIGSVDRLHQRYRMPLIPGGAEALAAARAAGAFATAINGSGSSLLAIGPRDRSGELAEVLASTLALHDSGAVGQALELVEGTPVVEAG